MACPKCGSENPEGQRFCGNCGAALAAICASCGSSNPPGQRFCGSCGTGLATVPVSATAAAGAGAARVPTTERRLVSVLFADLVGFTTLSESRDAEEVRELLSRYFDESRRIVERYAGIVEKFIGDAVMAVWGSPIAHEDDAERAVRAALELTAFVRDLGVEIGAPDLRARAGVLTGEAAVNLGAQGQGMVAGDMVNTASRIQSVAPPGAVLVGESTMRTTDRVIAYEPAGSHELKGKETPIELWRASRVVGLRRAATARGTFLEPPFTGRARELRMIKELFHDSAEHSRVHLASVQGVAGIGKSRLVWEFNKYIDGLVEDVWWHQGRCLAYGEGVAFWALAEMVRGRAGILEDEDSSSAVGKLTASIDQHISDETERRFVAPRLAHLLGLEDRGLGDQENLFAACRIYFERLADEGPSVMVFEDIHWADSALLDFIEYLAEWSRDRPIFVLTLARPELAERRPAWGSQTRNFTSIFLEPLPSEEMGSLLSDPIPGLPDELRERILERAEGIPFYAVETVRMLIDRGILVRENGGFRLQGSIETLEVPESLQALIAARLDGLEPEERRLLQDAAVMGRTFTKQGLVAITGLDGEEVSRLLGSLVRKEVLSISVDPLLSDRGQYGFLQDLVKKVAYDTMSRRERKARHVAAAAYLRSVADEDEIVEVVASHLLDAYLAAPDDEDAEAIRRDALDTLRRASERAASLGANVEAQRYAERAIELASDRRSAAELHERAGMMAVAHLDLEPAVGHFRKAIELFEAEGAKLPAARVSARLGDAMWSQGRGTDALEMMESAYRVLADEEPNADLAQLAAQLGRYSYFAGADDAGLARVDRALEIAEALDIPEVLSEAMNTKSLILLNDGRSNEATALLQFALTIALQHDKPSAALRAYNNLVDFADATDRYTDADRLVREGVALARRVGNRLWEFSLLGHVYPKYALGLWDELMASLQEIPPDEFTRSRLGFNQGYVAYGTAVEVHRGDLAAAARRLERFAEMPESADVQDVAEWACGAATLHLADGDPKEALRFAEDAMAEREALSYGHSCVKESFAIGLEAALRLEDHGKVEEILAIVRSHALGRRTPFYQGHAARIEARLPDRSDQDAERLFGDAIGAFRRIEAPFRLAVVLLEYAEWLEERGRRDDAGPLVPEARAIFQGLQAKPWLDRADRVGRTSAVTS
ncbi:MAG TPA: adenylate/guanylate cyclase domain-containing protein [Actinomycetota bacterium]|jgi:class 3 adenylate cyclase/tetratricopeptide (TPR) repeat protein|nr:adenylate/guanylate cyclase domain-containing protein [Actinomycetota bacterium]